MRSSGWLRKARRALGILALLLVGLNHRSGAVEYRPLPAAAQTGLGKDWLIHDASRNRLVLYLPGYHAPAHSYHQWVDIRPGRALVITFRARQGLSLFLDNRLIFTAEAPDTYRLDLAKFLTNDARAGSPAQHLLSIWHPEVSPDFASFSSAEARVSSPAKVAATAGFWHPQSRAASHQGENIFLCFLLLIGLLYGGIRTAYRPGFTRIYELWSNAPGEQSFLTRPTVTWLNLLLVIVFALSFGLLIVAIHTNIQSIFILRQLFEVSESGLVARVFWYASLVAAFVLLKVVYLALLGYIFDLSHLVLLQYREFVRSLLFMGLFLPVVMLLYLVLNQSWPEGVLWVSNGVVSIMLVGTVFRVSRTIGRRVPLLNLHLFSYLCATEIIPLAILIKLLVITY